MKSRSSLAACISKLALTAVASLGFSTATMASQPHWGHHPLGALGHVGPYEPPYIAPANAKSGTWKDVPGALPFKKGPETALLLTDGTVMVHDACYGQWYRLAPDKRGKYLAGCCERAHFRRDRVDTALESRAPEGLRRAPSFHR